MKVREKTTFRMRRHRRLVSDPVDLVTGELIISAVDFHLPGLIEFVLERQYLYEPEAQSDGARLFGANWRCALDDVMEAGDDGDICYRRFTGEEIYFERPEGDNSEANAYYQNIELYNGPNGSFFLSEDALTHHYVRHGEIWRLANTFNLYGIALTCHRREDGRPTRIDNGQGLSLFFEHHVAGGCTSLALRGIDGSIVPVAQYDYDAEGRLSQSRQNFGPSFRYDYDDKRRLNASASSAGTRTYHFYDEQSRVIRNETNGAFNGDAFYYDTEARSTEYAPGGDRTRSQFYYYNEEGNIVATRDSLGSETRTLYNAIGQVATEINGEGHETNYGYDGNGNLERVTDAEGRSTFYFWTRHHSLRGVLDGAGGKTRYKYDHKDTLIAIEDPLGNRTEIVNDEAGLPTRIMRADGLMEERSYDEHHRLIALRDFRGERQEWRRDAFGRVHEHVDAMGGSTRFAYDSQEGRSFWAPTQIERPDSVRSATSAGAGGASLSVTDGEGRVTQYRFGPFDVLAEVEDAAGGKLRFSYDGEKRLMEVRNQKNLAWTFERDVAGRVIREEDFDGLVLEYAYDKAGRLTETRHADGARIMHGYDRAGLLKREEAFERGASEATEVTRYDHDERGLLLRAENGTTLVEYERDLAGRITAEIVNERRVENTYDCCGNRIERRILGSGSGIARLVAATYDPLGMVSELVIGARAPLSFGRDALGRELSRASAAGFSLSQAYDAVGQLTSQRAGFMLPALSPGFAGALAAEREARSPGTGSIVERIYRWDRAFAPTSIKDKAWGDLAYSYNENGQILQTRFGDGGGERFRYDLALNTAGFGEGAAANAEALGLTPELAGSAYLGAQGEKGIQGWLLSDGGRVRLATGPHGERIELEHDVRGRVVRRKVERTGFRSKVWRYDWDAKDRLIRCTTPENENWRYGYDPFGRRVWKVRELTAAEMRLHAGRFPKLIDPRAVAPDYASMLRPPPSEQRRPVTGPAIPEDPDRPPVVGIAYGWDGDVIAEEAPLRLDGAIDWDEATHWHYEPNSFRPLAKETPDGRLFYLVTDHLGTPREMFEEDGKLAWVAEYRTWGEIRRLWLADASNDNGGSGGGQAMYPRGGKAGKDGNARTASASVRDNWDGGNSGSIAADAFSGGRFYGNLTLKDDPVAHEARFLCPIRFQGQWEDEETGLYYNRFRYYDPLAGQYVSSDPLGYLGGGRPYGYVYQPNVWADPLGLDAASDIQQLKGKSIPHIDRILTRNGFVPRNPNNPANVEWNHPDGSQIRVHKYGNVNCCGHKSGNNAHVHKQDTLGQQLNDRGIVSGNPDDTHIGIKNPKDLPIVRGRPHGDGS
ncbi:RHS repeat-associated core domain-containing protein [Labrys neptuniae]|uniref:RHS repeat-associated core domain-containing protein n=1 Tax=Labrys neptuniae TaxID=376174 RepID=UPI00288DAA85|nr:RHS repeat-associated core domain-containing protein [Labrys neptuniae]MDT3381163.1 RHS repeat-associated core domain-containing protein [Labrys neptuniae]